MIQKRRVTGFRISLLVILAIAIVFSLSFKTVVVKGPSMQPTFFTGRRLLVSSAYWLVGSIQNKDIVVVKDSNPDGYIIKRVYKMGGETVGGLNVPKFWGIGKGPFVVPQGSIYVLGDNSAVSDDSRSFGPVPLNRVLGKVVIWP